MADGPPADSIARYTDLVDRLHQAGIGVLVDWVAGRLDTLRPEKFVLTLFGGEPLLNLPVIAERPLFVTRVAVIVAIAVAILGWSGLWDSLPAAHVTASAFDVGPAPGRARPRNPAMFPRWSWTGSMTRSRKWSMSCARSGRWRRSRTGR